MGDGGVACAPSQHVMATISETFCGGGGFNSKAVKFADSNSAQQRKGEKMELEKGEERGEFDNESKEQVMKSQREDVENGEIVLEEPRKGIAENGDVDSSSSAQLQTPRKVGRRKDSEREELGSEKGRKNTVKKGYSGLEKARKVESGKLRKGEVENGEIVPEKQRKVGAVEKGEIAPGKLRRREIEKGEIVSEKPRKGDMDKAEDEIEKGEFVPDKWRKGEIEKGEFVIEKSRRAGLEREEYSHGRIQKGEIEKGEFDPEKWWRREELDKSGIGRGRREEEVEKGEFIPDRWRNGDVEKGEIVSDKWRKGDAVKEEFASGKGRRREVEKGEFIPGKGWKDELDRTPKKETPSSVKFGDRSGSDQRRRSSRWESSNERDLKSSSRIVDGDLGLHKQEYNDGKNHCREHSFGAWPKRDVLESESSNRKNHGDFGEYLGYKSRRISDDNNHSTYSDKLHSSVERSYRNVSLSSKVSTSSRYASRLYESSSRGGGSDRRGRSPYHERSPHDRVRYQNHRDRSPARPSYSDRSPHDRTRYQSHRDRSPARAGHHDHRDRTPGQSERSPHDRGRHRDHRERTPAHLERSPRDRARHRDHKERSPAHSERSPHDRGRHHDHKDQSPRPQEHREGKRKSGVATERQHSQFESQGHEEKLGQRESAGRDSHRHSTGRRSHDGSFLHNSSSCPDKDVDLQASKGNELQDTMVCNELSSQANDTHEEFQSMEEDMDICDTPPHVPVVANSSLGKWFYLDHFGIEQGPSKLCVLRRLVEEGLLQSDHLIKHAESDRWVTVENAASPLVPVNLRSVVSDTVTELVNPPEAPGNLLVDIGDVGSPMVDLNESSATLESLDELDIDERVRALLKGYTVIPGKELETLGEALHTMFEHVDWERWGASTEGFTRSRGSGESSKYPRDEDFSRGFNSMLKDLVETRSGAPSGECLLISSDSSDWFSSLWSCKGGDWKRNEEVAQDRCLKRKLVLNEGYPLCQMPKSGYEDPRWHKKDDLYFPSHSKRLDLPHWAFTLVDEKNDTNGDISKIVPASRSSQVKPSVLRGVKGTILPVVRINACVVKDHGSFVSDPRIQTKGNERHCSRSIRSFSTSSSDGRSSSMEPISESRKVRDSEPQALHKCRTVINIPKDHVCRVDELQLDLGDWYYLDGAGHERGPLSFSELQSRVAQGIIPKYSSVFRKIDKVWVPITSAQMGSETVHGQTEGVAPTADSSSVALLPPEVSPNVMEMVSSSFHNSHPQFIGYTRGKLHELVMKSYRSREFAAAINEVLDPWMSARQPKKEMDKHFPFNSSISDLANDSAYKFRKPEGSLSRIYNDYSRAGKRARFLVDESDEGDEMEGDAPTYQKNEFSFEDLCGEGASVQTESESWGLLSDTILARVFHFLRSDLRSLAFSAATCKCWSTAVKFYRDISRQVDLSSMGSDCTDSMFQNIMSGYEKTKITSIVLMGCTNVSAAALEEVLQSFPCISSVDIRGCNQFRELMYAFKNIKWVRSRGSCNSKILEESHSKMRSLRQITEKNSLNSKAFRGSSGHFDASVELGDAFDDDSNLDRKDTVSYALRQNCYKRRKLLNGRKPSAVLSRDAHMRRWFHRKSGNGYKRVEEFLAISLKDIMKENKSEFFVTKVSEIEDRMRNGYYIGHGLSSVKEDISRMCRDAIKARSRGDARDMNHIIMLFIRLVKSLEENLKSSNDREDALKMLKDSSVAGLSSTASKYKKRNSNIMSERKAMIRSNGTFSGMDFADYASDREIRRRLSKLNKRSFDSESETSDDLDLSEDNGRSDAENTDSDTESDLEFHSEGGHADMRDGLPFVSDESFDTMTEDREWGARMTKAGLVPPVTRKYEVIDRYVILADEELVQRKMQVALPDDYAEKLVAQKNGIEEADMEIPEVKDYKPRKRLGDEVLEQEVYGIDPYTHNLLLDSMPEESEWPQSERHLFIEEVLLRALNKQVRHFTGTGNTPMMYSLQPVLEEVLKTAEEEGDTRIMKMCQCILKAIRNRPEDTYVAYRKGLGVVCNKEEGFGEDDFVVEFLGEVYPAWKWFEKQDGIRSLQKNSKDPAPEFYNIYLERPKGDRDGYDLVVVDAMHKANYASRICHSCRPNCEAKVTAVDGQYQIGIYSVRPICHGEEITFDYNSVTESKEEFKASVCLCGSQVCRGSYLNLTGEGAFQKVFKECHGILDRHQLMLEACEVNLVSQEDYIDLGRAGLGTCLLDGLPEWLIAYSARLVRFINFERTKLPEEILKHNLEEKRKFFSDICLEVERSDAEIQAEGVYNQRLQNLALTLDKVRYVMRSVFGDARKAPPPLEKLSPEALVSLLWKGEGSLVQELLQCMAPHMEADSLNDLKVKILAHDPSGSNDPQSGLQKSLLWLRDEIRNLPCTHKSRHDAAADLIHIYAHTKCFFKVQDYKSITSPPVYISPLDLGPKYADKLGSGFQEYCKTYGENYCLGQLIYWHIQTNAEPDRSLARARRGCLSLPDVATFYTKSQKPSRKHVYGPRTLKFMLARMEKQPQRPWPKDHIWTFKSSPQIFGSPMFDAVLNKSALDREMLQWLKSRPFVFQAMWDR